MPASRPASPAAPPAAGDPATVVCPGCGCVLGPVEGDGAAHPGASAACARLFEVTLRGLRDDGADPATAAILRLADDAYDAQHPGPGAPQRLEQARARLARRFGVAAGQRPPDAWRTTIADVAADLDVIDLPALVEAWARAVAEDWGTSHS